MKTIVAAVLLLLFNGSAAFGENQPTYDFILFESNLMIPMRDGVRLASDVYRPVYGGRPISDKLPVLLQRTPYNKNGGNIVASAEYFARHGYVVVLQDLRGRYQSEGVFTKYIGEGRDGYDTIEFIAKLPYSNGKVGMWGTSYASHAQANAAKLKPPHLQTMVINMGGLSNGWDHKVRNHGAFELQQLTWAFSQLAEETDDPVIRKMLNEENVRDWLSALPLRKGLNPLSVAPNFEDFILTMQTHGDYDEYWKNPDVNWVEYYDSTADIPMLLLSGWYDSYGGGTIENYIGLSQRLKSPVKLVMGAWTHGGNTRTHAGNVEFGADAGIADFHQAFHLRWFDRYLKDRETGVDDSAVRVFVMGNGDGHKDEDGRLYHGGYWREAADWPLPDTQNTPYYFHADGTLQTAPPTDESPPTTYTFDPADPVPTIGGSFSSTGPVFEPGAYDQRETADVYGSSPPYLPLGAREDVVVFQTEPLAQNVEVIGPIAVRLFVSSSAVDTDFTAKLIDAYPPSADFPSGYNMNLTDGILRTRYRNRADRQEFMKPRKVYELTVTPFPTANLFKTGHRIRIDISSSNFPRFDVNPNTGEALGKNRRAVEADNSIYHDADHPSHVILPIVISNAGN